MLDLWSVKSEYRPLLEKSANIDIEDDNASANMIRSFFISPVLLLIPHWNIKFINAKSVRTVSCLLYSQASRIAYRNE